MNKRLLGSTAIKIIASTPFDDWVSASEIASRADISTHVIGQIISQKLLNIYIKRKWDLTKSEKIFYYRRCVRTSETGKSLTPQRESKEFNNMDLLFEDQSNKNLIQFYLNEIKMIDMGKKNSSIIPTSVRKKLVKIGIFKQSFRPRMRFILSGKGKSIIANI